MNNGTIWTVKETSKSQENKWVDFLPRNLKTIFLCFQSYLMFVISLYTGKIVKFQILHLKITKIYPNKSKICIFFAFNLEKFTPDRIFYTGSARGARDKYEVWPQVYMAPTKKSIPLISYFG